MKFQPQHVDFLDVSNPRAVLEKTLRSFSCVTKVGVTYIAFDFWLYSGVQKSPAEELCTCML